MYNYTIIGTCSQCRGPVVVPKVWFGVKSPIPYCLDCGAIAMEDYGPVIPTRPSSPYRWEKSEEPICWQIKKDDPLYRDVIVRYKLGI